MKSRWPSPSISRHGIQRHNGIVVFQSSVIHILTIIIHTDRTVLSSWKIQILMDESWDFLLPNKGFPFTHDAGVGIFLDVCREIWPAEEHPIQHGGPQCQKTWKLSCERKVISKYIWSIFCFQFRLKMAVKFVLVPSYTMNEISKTGFLSLLYKWSLRNYYKNKMLLFNIDKLKN